MKQYKLGLIVGRFQMLHNGHVEMISTALELCDRVVVFIGSSQKQNTKENPFSYFVREQMIESAFSVEANMKKLLIRPLPDIGVGNNDMWGRYVLGVFEEEFFKQPDLYVTGCEKERGSWFTDYMAPCMDELRITRKKINISASKCREFLLKDDETNWKKNVPCELHGSYDFYKKVIQDIYSEDE